MNKCVFKIILYSVHVIKTHLFYFEANNNCIPVHGGSMPGQRAAGHQSKPEEHTSVVVDRHASLPTDLDIISTSRVQTSLPGSSSISSGELCSTLTELKPVYTPAPSGGYATRDIALVPVYGSQYESK